MLATPRTTRWLAAGLLLPLSLGTRALAPHPPRATDPPLWLRYPAISPDGQTIAFSYQGDIYTVPATGGDAHALTLGESYESYPVWSHDGKSIAFASDRYGNFDIFVMPSTGGEAKRLTWNSTGEIPSSFTADDKAVLFTAYRQELSTDAQFPGVMAQLWSVPASGGRVSMVLPVTADNATTNAAGNKLLYENVTSYENQWRKHATSSATRHVWLYDMATKQYQQLTHFAGEDRNPVFDADGNGFYYLSEESGSFNVWKSSLSNPAQHSAVTHFTRNPVRFLTRASNGTLSFAYDGEIYTMAPGNEPKKLAVRIAEDGRHGIDKVVPVNSGFTEATLSPNGKEFAYVFRGEIFVSSIETGVTKRITNTPWQERSVNFSPDGRSLVYAVERDSSWEVYETSIVRKDEPYFFTSTVLKETPVAATKHEEYQPTFSPDGKEVAYLEDRVVLKVINLATHQSRTILGAEHNYSYADGDQYYAWSPDSKWFLVSYGLPDRIFTPEVGLVAADGTGGIRDLTHSGYDNYRPKWVLDGKAMIFASDREGTWSQGGGLTSSDVYVKFFDHAAWDRFQLSKEQLEVAKQLEDSSKKTTTDTSKAAKPAADTAVQPIRIDSVNIDDRQKRLTVNTSPLSDWVLSKDGEKLYYLTSFDKGNDLWVTEPRTHETRLFVKLGADNASMELSKDGKFLFVLADGKVETIATDDGKVTPVSPDGEMILNTADERSYIFDHAWRQFEEKLIYPEITNVDWNYYYRTYHRFLPYINNNYDFADMLSEMLGEVNVSHTGAGYRAGKPNTDQTAALGLLYDFTWTGDGMKIAEVVEAGPADNATSKIAGGDVLEAIDGVPITPSMDFSMLLNRKVGKPTLVSLLDPRTNTRWDERLTPISGGAENNLLYERWVKQRRHEVDSLSGGRLAYVHVRAMDDASMRTVFDEIMGRGWNKDAVIVDTRFNGGGNLHEQLSDFLSGKKYFDIIPHGQLVGFEPGNKWIKPSIVLINEGDYSDGHLFPLAYKLKDIGKTLGMPIAGTGTFVWWENQIDPSLVFGIPMGAWRMPDGKFAEGTQLEPDIKVPMDPAVMTAGRDQQIEAAVRELMKK